MRVHAERPSVHHLRSVWRSRRHREERQALLRGGLGEGRPAVPRRLRGSAGRQGGQRHRRRLHPRQDPRHREGSRDGGDAAPTSTIPIAAKRRRSTPTTSRPSTATTSRWSMCAPRRSSGSRRTASARARREYHVGHHRVCHRLRRHDRPDAADGHPGPRRALAARGMGGRAAHLSRPADRRASRTCSPSPAPAVRPCWATCRWRSSSTPTGSRDCIAHMREHGLERIEASRKRWTTGCEKVNDAAERDAAAAWRRIPGTSARTCRASRACSCPMPAGWRATGICERSRRRTTGIRPPRLSAVVSSGEFSGP